MNKKNKTKGFGFSICDCPISLYKWFVGDIEHYNDCYWAKLQDLRRKSEMYDYIMSGGPLNMPVDVPYKDEEEKVDEEFIETFGGRHKVNKK